MGTNALVREALTVNTFISGTSSWPTSEVREKGVDGSGNEGTVGEENIINNIINNAPNILNSRYGEVTDGGEVDVFGIIPLLRARRTKIVAFYDSPHRVAESQVSYLFGVAAPNSSNLCINCIGSSGVQQQVFPTSLWSEVVKSMNDRTNTGLTLKENVQVIANPAMGVPAYTLEKLLIIDNNEKDGFEQTYFGPNKDAIVAELTASASYPVGEGLKVPTEMAVTLSLMAQWKVNQNAAAIREALA